MLKLVHAIFSSLKKLILTSDVLRLLRKWDIFPLWLIIRSGFSKPELQRWKNYRQFKKKYQSLLTGNIAVQSGPKILFVHLLPIPPLAFIEGMLAKSLELRGAQIFFLLQRMNCWEEQYLRVFGHRHFLYIEDYLPDAGPYAKLASDFIAASGNVYDILNIQFHQADVGRHALSTALLWKRGSSFDMSNQALMSALHKALTYSLQAVLAAERILETLAPSKLITYEGGFTPQAEFYNVALMRNIDTIRWFRSHKEHALLFRRYQYADRYEHYFNLADETWRQVRELPWPEEKGEWVKESLQSSYLAGLWFKRKNMMEGKKFKTPEQIRSEFALAGGKPNVFVFSHVLWDATFWFGDNLFKDYGEWLIETIRAACENTNANWVIKMHPDNVWKQNSLKKDPYSLAKLDEYCLIQKHFPTLPPHVRLMPPESDTNPVSLFGVADYAVTVRGTVGIEFPCFGTPALTAGTGRYSGRGFTIDSDTREAYLEKLRHIHELPRMTSEQQALAQRFAYYVFHLRPLSITSFTWKQNLSKQSDWIEYFELILNIAGLEELSKAHDMNIFSNWALDSKSSDLLMPENEKGESCLQAR
ncbi:MAG: hypothetical protein HY586_06805 [Candidatus Omnitrophica bacterium]|nr:hypothetical protein [Candidatus Omnitrophota bacterium]